jgi:nucleotide-binding universal stress UspA family protein
MANVLLVIPPGITPQQTLAAAIESARHHGGKLIALMVLDPDEPRRIASSLDGAFVGERVSDNVVEVLAREQRAQAESVLRQVCEIARQQQISCDERIEEGDAGEICARVIRQQNVAAAILVAEKRSWLTRFLSRSAAVRLPALSGCEVRVMEEEGGMPA